MGLYMNIDIKLGLLRGHIYRINFNNKFKNNFQIYMTIIELG